MYKDDPEIAAITSNIIKMREHLHMYLIYQRHAEFFRNFF